MTEFDELLNYKNEEDSLSIEDINAIAIKMVKS